MTVSLPKGEARNSFIAAITSLYSMTDSIRHALDAWVSQELKSVQGSTDEVSAPQEFDERLQDLRLAIRSESSSKDDQQSKPLSGDRKEIVTARIRYIGWVFSAVVSMVVLFKGWNGRTADLPGIIFISILVPAVIVGLVELVVLVVRKFVS
jgi:hypothetical protein